MNSEELERSLRTEFESHLKNVVAGMQQDVADFQKNFEAEFQKHKSQLDEAFRELSTRLESDTQFEPAFISSVVEHLRLARDGGAELAATAFGEAEKLAEETAQPAAKFDKLRDAIKDISGKSSQGEILSSLVGHAAEFSPRGAFFIVKNDRFVGWKSFDKEGGADDEQIREINFPMASDTVLAEAVKSLTMQESAYGSRADDSLFLEPLNFARPDRMYAIPLTARGRGVAVLYADYGTDGVTLNAEALETLVRVAGLTVELLAASQVVSVPAEAPAVAQQAPEAELNEPAQYEPAEEAAVAEYADSELGYETVEEPVENTEAEAVEEYQGEVSYELPETAEESPVGLEFVNSEEEETPSVETESYFEPVEEPEAVEIAQAEEKSFFEPEAEPETIGPEFEVSAKEAAFAPSDSFDGGLDDEPGPVSYTAPVPETAGWGNGGGVSTAIAEPTVQVAAVSTARIRFSDRNVDLPIEVSEEDRRVHVEALRFARLLVSEIKLYNKETVEEGRETDNLYDRLRDSIDRSREMYAKRVKPAVASRFDYFHYELVNSLAEGNEAKLGTSYPGSQI
ncbi:MAG: hypothetical protein WKF92_10315 [Pyrinomonadaceae bacterium]